MTKKTVLSSLALVLCAIPALAQTPTPAATPAAAPAPASSSIDIGGLVDAYYDFYSTKPDGDAQYRNFDTRHNQFAVSMAQLWIGKTATADSRVGFKLKLGFGPAYENFIHSSEPGRDAYRQVGEAYVSYLAPVGKGLQLDAGVFVTPLGAEVIEAKDNMNYSRGLLFTLAIPYYHSGVRLTYAPSDKVSLAGGVVNGWNDIVDNNTGKTVFGSVTVKPTGKVSIIENVITGPEQAGTNDNKKTVSDTIVSIAANDMMTFVANYDYGRESFGSASTTWQGFAAYLKLQANKTVAFTPRVEIYDDPDGATTGHVQTLKEVTGTLELKASDNLLWRIELRRDWSNIKTFDRHDGTTGNSQQSIGFGLLYSFAGKIQ